MKRRLHALAAAALSVAAGSSMAINVGGLELPDDSTFAVASIYENVVTDVGQTLSGVGEVTQINGVAVGTLCAGCELTYRFGGYEVTSISATDITFADGWINFYLGSGADDDFNPFATGSSAADFSAATNGTLFLTLAGHAIDAAGNTFAGTGRDIGTQQPVGFGAGLADVDPTGSQFGNPAGTGGLANSLFDTNMITAQFGGNADFQLSTSFSTVLLPHPQECPGGPMCVAGSSDIRGVIPEPQTYALLLAGLGAVGFVARRRKQG